MFLRRGALCAFLVQNRRNLPLQYRNILLGSAPDKVQIDAHVVVNEDIAHPGHAPPSDFGMPITQLSGEPLRRFANDLQLPDDRVLSHRFGEKLLFPNSCIRFNFGDGAKDVFKVVGVSTYSGVASCRILSRRFGLRAPSVTT
jgi:hypothetical protein